MRFSKEAQLIIERLYLLSGESKESIKNILESIVTMVSMDFASSQPSFIPLLGSLTIDYKGDIFTSEGKEASLTVSINPDPFLKRVIGQIKDGVETDIDKIFTSKIMSSLGCYLE